jgi:26 proteasome complex subunit DSS1
MSNPTTQKADATEQAPPQAKPQVLEEDDEFEDFPVEGINQTSKCFPKATKLTLQHPDWPQEEAEQSSGSTANGGSEHLWEESWDDDDAADDFSKQLQ